MNRNYLLTSLLVLAFYVTISDAIIDGNVAERGQFPYQVSLLLDGKPTCGGAIIGHQFVLTAAHCVLSEFNNFRGSRMSVVAGAINLNDHRNPDYLEVPVSKIYTLSEYNQMFNNNTGDIAVLRLRRSLEFHKNKHLGFLTMPRTSLEDFTDRTVKIAGYGWNTIRLQGMHVLDGHSDNHLRYANGRLFNDTLCQAEYRGRPLTEKHICAKVHQYRNVERGCCFGDGGSPLVYHSTVIGILSVIPLGCSERSTASVYTRVSLYKPFIRDAMNDRPRPEIRTLELHH